MHSARSGITSGRPTACTSPTTTSAGFTEPSASRLRWKRGLRSTFGTLRNCWHELARSTEARMLPFSSARRRDGVGHQKSRLNRSRAPGEEKALKTVYTESNLLYDKKQAHQKWAVFMADRKQFQNRSEEHTSELQSPCNLVCRLLLEKKKNSSTDHTTSSQQPQEAVYR